MSLVRPKVVTACTTVASAVLRLTRKVSRTGLEFTLSFIPAGVQQGVHRSRRYRKCLAAGQCEEKSSFRGRAREGLRAGRACAHETLALSRHSLLATTMIAIVLARICAIAATNCT